MFETILLTSNDINNLQLFIKCSEGANIYKNNNELLKIFNFESKAKAKKIMTIHNYFLKNPQKEDIIPNKAIFIDNEYAGYSEVYDHNFKPLTNYKNDLDFYEKLRILKKIIDKLIKHNNDYIFMDIVDSNILYNGENIKFIDFDDIYLTNNLKDEKSNNMLNSQKDIYNLFAIAFILNLDINDIYFMNNFNTIDLATKKIISNILTSNHFLLDELTKLKSTYTK